MIRSSPSSGYSIVAPHAGAWIEINSSWVDASYEEVAPHAGAWIEIILAW